MIEDLVAQMETRFAELGAQLTDPEVISDRERYAEVGRAYSQLEPAAKLAAQWRRAQDDAAGAEEMLEEDGEDPEVRVELTEARERIEQLEEEIRLAMVERDPNDDKNVIVEIQGGAGGDEAGLWARDLYRMLTKYAERRGLQTEPLDASEGKYTFAVKGDSAYSIFKFEGGTHRVQRVPATESQGRIHTSTATVAVEVWIRPWDSVAGTRWTRWVPPSNLKMEYAESPLTANVYLPSLASNGSVWSPRRSAYLVSIR